MVSLANQIVERETGQYPLTIGTSLALEGAIGIHPDNPDPSPAIGNVKALWVNVKTVIRNLINALPTELRGRCLPQDLWEVVYEDLMVIPNVVTDATGGRVGVHFYYTTHRSLKSRFPGAILKEPKTELQHFLQNLEEYTLKLVLENNQHLQISEFDFELLGRWPASLILTHQPVDLLSRYNFDRLLLLESHTGKVKGAGEWNTKLQNGKELVNIPFNKLTLQIFGDSGGTFVGLRSSVRKEVIALATRWGWTSVTTVDKVKTDLVKIANDSIRGEVVKIT